MNLRNVKLFRAVMHDELESAYWITRLMLIDALCWCTTSTTWCLCSLSTKSNQANKFHFFQTTRVSFFKRMAHQHCSTKHS
jgi:hypothetical protein